MKEARSSKANVIDATRAFNVLKVFKRGFENQPASVQSSILKTMVNRLVVKKDMTIILEVFGSGPEVIGEIKKETATETQRSPFLTVSKVVRPVGVEPTTYSFGNCHSIQLSYGRMG